MHMYSSYELVVGCNCNAIKTPSRYFSSVKQAQRFTRSTIHNEGFEKNKLFVVAINSKNVLILKSCAESDLHSRVTKRSNYWDDCIHEMNVAQNISDILLPYCLTSRLYLESECDDLSSDLCNLQISFELPSSEYDISRSHLNHRRQLLRWLHSRDECGTKHIRHSLAFPRDCIKSQNAMVLVLSYGISRSHLNHRCQLLRRLHSSEWCGT